MSSAIRCLSMTAWLARALSAIMPPSRPGLYRDGFRLCPRPAGPCAAYTCAVTSEGPAGFLRRVFGYDSFRGDQQEIIEHLIAGGDALVLMPTGGGKSLCYQMPAMIRQGIGVVVSPLIALM